jgi:integrase
MNSVTYNESEPDGASLMGTAQPAARLTAAHFAFMRAVIQGVSPAESWIRYLGNGEAADARLVRRTIAWIKDVYAAAARQQGRHGAARLFSLDLNPRSQGKAGAPTLGEFVRAAELDGFSEQEQLGLYRQQYGTVLHKRQRQASLVTRQLQALSWLQQNSSGTPSATDSLERWLDPRLAGHLAAAGITQVNALLELMARRGTRWWKGIDSIGAAKAGRIADWVHTHAQALGQDHRVATQMAAQGLGGTAASSGDAALVSLLPLHRLPVSDALDGRSGAQRLTQAGCRIAATTDVEALRSWLQARRARGADADLYESTAQAVPGWDILQNLTHTQRAYWKEAQRFQLWLVHARSTTLSAATALDCSAYLDFLENPAPHWCSPRSRGQTDPAWRPFEGPLSPAARRFARTVLHGLYRFLVDAHYLATNPWDAATGLPAASSASAAPRSGSTSATRRFDADARDVVDRCLRRLPPTSANARLGFAVPLLQQTGLRLGEALRATTDDLIPPAAPGAAWRLHVPGRSAQARSVVLPPALVQCLQGYLLARGLATGPDLSVLVGQGIHLLGRATDVAQRAPWAPCAQGSLDRKAGIGAGTLRDQLAEFFTTCAHASLSRPALATQFERASSHWLRGEGDLPGRVQDAATPKAAVGSGAAPA